MTLTCTAEESMTDNLEEARPVCFSLGIMAWNEETSIQQTLESLFQQSVFQKLALRHERCELFCLANGCTDETVALASELFRHLTREHPYGQVITARVVD